MCSSFCQVCNSLDIFKNLIDKFIIILGKGDSETRICGSIKRYCYDRAVSLLYDGDIDSIVDTNAKSFRMNCDCLPACNTIEYKTFVDNTKSNIEMEHLSNPA